MPTSYFTFGQNHRHEKFNGVFDKDVVVKMIAADPRAMMCLIFGQKWAFQYEQEPDMSLYPGGLVQMDCSVHEVHEYANASENDLAEIRKSETGLTKQELADLQGTRPSEEVRTILIERGLHPDFFPEFLLEYSKFLDEQRLRNN